MMEANREYVTNKILAASPMELVRILYETALDSVNRAIFYLRSGEVLERGRAITKAVEVVNELKVSLRPVSGNDYSNNLTELYGYIQRQLLKAHAEKSEAVLAEVSRLLSVLLEGWVGAMKSNRGSPEQADLLAADPSDAAQSASAYVEDAAVSADSARSWQF